MNNRISVTSYCAIVVALASPAFGNAVDCVSGNLSTVDHTTCDIGNLQFTFEDLVGYNSLQNNNGNYVYYNPWNASDFTFTVLSNGFELSGPPAQSITAPPGTYQEDDYVYLYFAVTDLNGGIYGVNIAGGNLSASGPGAYAENVVGAGGYEILNEINNTPGPTNTNGAVVQYVDTSTPFVSGSGAASPFVLGATPGSTASIDNTTTDFTFVTGPTPTPVPEPIFSILLAIGIPVMGYAAKSRWN
jgi:hypothetical protein